MKRLNEPAQSLAILIAGLAGFVDVVAFLSLGGFFASFMSGNSTRLAIGINGNGADALLAAQLVAAFLAGVVGASLLALKLERHRIAGLLALVAGLNALCALIAKPYQAEPLLLLALAMGAVNTLFSPKAGAGSAQGGIALTYMTGTLVRMGQAIAGWVSGRAGPGPIIPLALMWSGFLGGGLAGAGLYARFGLSALWGAAAMAAALALWVWRKPALFVDDSDAPQAAETAAN